MNSKFINQTNKDSTMNTQEFIKTVNTLRTTNKGSWYQWCGEVNNYDVSLKGYGTWVQRLKVDDVIYGGNMDVSVKEFKEFLSFCVCVK